ncbi:MAG TPA: GNAT family N-acetyltransferase [Caulobacteraceae bacterium]|nr:GNAT family N-acetyltransferase [Caulobacteraceae bacterium]
MSGVRSSTELSAQVVHPSALASEDARAWRSLQTAYPAFASPLLGPDFAAAVGAVRDDARVAVFRKGGKAAGFLPFHQRPGAFGRPIGAPFSDYHALVAGPGLAEDGDQLLEKVGLQSLRLSGLIDPYDLFQTAAPQRVWAHRIVLEHGAEAYLDALFKSSGNRLKNFKRYSLALERDFGPLRLVAPDRDRSAFDQLIAWKRRQLDETGLHDFLNVAWSHELMRRLFETTEDDFQGAMVSLYAGDRLVLAHFGVRLGDWFHPWLAAYDTELHHYSPGLVHQIEAIRAMPALSLRTYDLGPSGDHWKRMFALGGVWVGIGMAGAPASNMRGEAGGPLLSRVRNRMDHIASLELTLAGRVQGAAQALAGMGARGRSRRKTG